MKALYILSLLIAVYRFPVINPATNMNKIPLFSCRDTLQKPVVSLEDTVVDTICMVEIRDTAAKADDFNRLLQRDYAQLFSFIIQQGLRPGKIMVFYHTMQPPFVFDAAVEVDKFPVRLTDRMRINKTRGGPVLIAHYKGPYDQIAVAYTAIKEWLEQHNKQVCGFPFEVYLNNPSSVKDPFELRTDVYQELK